MQPDAGSNVIRDLRLVERRLLVRDLLLGITSAAIACAAIVVAFLVTRTAAPRALLIFAALSVPTFVVVMRHRFRTLRDAALSVERAAPSCRNVVITAVELLNHPERAVDWVRGRVFADAARQLAAIRTNSVVPLARPLAGGVASVAAAALLIAIQSTGVASVGVHGSSARPPPAGAGLTMRVHLQPPSYTGLSATTVNDPQRLDVLEGTRARFTFDGSITGLGVRFGDRAIESREEQGRRTADVLLVESGYVAVDGGGRTTLIPVTVTADRTPEIRIDRPGRDLILPASTAAIDVVASASDDLALESMSLHYTKISGSGEQFEFVEGELPIEISRKTSQAWYARGRISLRALNLEPGHSIVYRVTARDRRPGGAGTGSSETFFIEVAGPGQVAIEGLEMPPEQDRYALSQQMIVLRIQRLRGGEARLTHQALLDEAGAIAAEQRAVRANFVFLMGGHVEDEEEEAEQEHEIQEGRLQNTARQEISRAVRHMSATEEGLVAANTTVSLAQARLAVEALQRALGRNRYILRTLGVRSRIDPSRRLSGDLGDAQGMDRALTPASESPRGRAARTLLAAVVSVAHTIEANRRVPVITTGLTRAVEQALAIDPDDGQWQRIVRAMLAFRDAAARGEDPLSDERHRAAIRGLANVARDETLRPSAAAIPATDRLRSSWTEERSRR